MSETREKSILDVTKDINGKKIRTYLGFQGIKAANVKIYYTQEMWDEYQHCANDLLYYAETYFYHVHPDEGLKKIVLYPYQREILPSLQRERFHILLQSRQSGKCVDYTTHIIIRNKYNKEEQNIKIGNFYDRITNHLNSHHLPLPPSEDKFTDIIQNDDFEVFTNTGWQKFGGIGKTIPYTKYEIKTTNHKLICADDHLLFDGVTNKVKYAKKFVVGDLLITKKGTDKIVEIIIHKSKKPMYDLMDVENGKRYFTNGLLSHNSTVVSIFCTWYAMFHDHKTVVIVSKDKESAKDVLDKIKISIENLPMGLQQGLIEWNKSSIHFENGSKILVKANARGATGNVLLIDEAAFVRGWGEFSQSSLPIITVSKDSKLILVSTPNGKNHFFDYWWKANLPLGNHLKNHYIPYFVPWDKVPGRDEKWKQLTLTLLGEDATSHETAESKFEREFNCKFDSKVGSLVSADTLRYYSSIYKEHLNIEELLNTVLKSLKDYKDNLRLFELPIRGHKYVIGCDTSTNVEKGNGDETSFQILDITSFPVRQVGVFEARLGFTYREFPYILKALGDFYNEAWIFIENNEGAGRETNRTLEDLGYEHLYWDNSTLAGFRTTVKSKKLGCENLKMIADNLNLLIYDIDTIGQMGNFVRKRTSYGGDGKEPDDKVMALLAALYFLMITDDIMLQNIFGEDSETVTHHGIFHKIINKNIENAKEASIINEQDVLHIMLRDDVEEIQERIMRNMNIQDEPKETKEWDIFDIMEEEIKEREDKGYVPF